MPARARKPRSLETGAAAAGSRFDRRLGEILDHATTVFYEKGYEGASMRDLSRSSGMSLAGLYYYFDSKEKLLHLIQKHTFATIMEQLKLRLEGVSDPEERIRVFIRNHLEYFLANMKAMKVLSHEDEALTGSLGAEIAAMKREYFRLCRGLVEDLKRTRGGLNGDISTRTAVLCLFGMMNWIYTWHNPRTDLPADELADQMANSFLHGVLGNAREKRTREAGSVQKTAAKRPAVSSN